MMRSLRFSVFTLFVLHAGWLFTQAQKQGSGQDTDARVKSFLETKGGSWHDLNVPTADGQKMYDIILSHNYKRALEIGTSTGHSGTWIAWALSKTGGTLITVEIDRSRHETAVANFRSSGLDRIIDARLGDAHQIVPRLPGPFDFVFSDADKDWYRNYFDAVLPKLAVGGCFVAHNVSGRGYGENRDFLRYLQGLSFMETTLFNGGAGMSISYRKSDK
jgi:caffeoyl-CoA O-methyltransferase